MRHRVELQNRQATDPDSRGNITGDWETTDVMPAEIVALSGREAEIARQLVADATHRVRVRADQRITPKSRFVFEGRNLYVGHVERVAEVNHWMKCLVSEKT